MAFGGETRGEELVPGQVEGTVSTSWILSQCCQFALKRHFHWQRLG